MSGFTKGQWAVGEYDDFSESYTVIQDGSRREGRGYVVTVDICEGASEANAKLIAAAPDLLEALEEILDGYLYGCDMKTKRENIKKANAAIAKARGAE